ERLRKTLRPGSSVVGSGGRGGDQGRGEGSAGGVHGYDGREEKVDEDKVFVKE
ncbi:hypothetical protein JOQ06_008190, partial [Pogonophryne albipinna]